MNLEQQIEQLKANPNVGGVEWEITRYSYPQFKRYEYCTKFGGYKLEVFLNENNVFYISSEFVHIYDYQKLKSTTLNEALLEALHIVKAKVKELAKVLGYVCYSQSEVDYINLCLNERQQYITEQGHGTESKS